MILQRRDTSRDVRRSAFTLLEVLIVVAILIMLVGVGGVYFFRYLEDSRKDKAKIDLQTLSKVAQTYQVKHGEFPPNLMSLLQPPDGSAPYLESADAIKDPWGHEYQYDPSGQRNAGIKPDVWTTAPDGTMIGNWPGGK